VSATSRALRPLRLRSASAPARPPGDPVARLLDTYRPGRIDPERWDQSMGEFVRLQILRLNVGLEVARDLAWALAYLADWCVDEHIPLEVDRVLDPDTVERYCAEGFRGSPSATGTVRSHLRRLGPALTATAPWAPPPPSYERTKLPPPYSEAELALITRDVHRQATGLACHSARAVLALGLGVGLDGRWNTEVEVSHLRRRSGILEIAIPAPNARLVVARDRYAAELLALAEAVGTGPLVGRVVDHKNAASRIANETVIDQGRLRLVTGRLRSTWLVAHLEAGTQFPVLLEAAGLKSFGTLNDLLPFVRPLPTARARQELREA